MRFAVTKHWERSGIREICAGERKALHKVTVSRREAYRWEIFSKVQVKSNRIGLDEYVSK